MAIYSIRDVEKLSGIKAHTLRIWEQRYDFIKPKRTPTNIRYYNDDDLKLLLNIALLNKNGIKISKIAEMTENEIFQKVSSISEINTEYYTQLDALTISTIEMDEEKFERIIASNIEILGFEKTMLRIIYPFLEKLSLHWITGSVNPVQENFMTHLIRQKIIVAIDKLKRNPARECKKFVLFLPEGDTQELTMLFISFLLKSRGYQVIYLGYNISLLDLNDVYKIHQPEFLFTMITESFTRQPVQSYVRNLADSFQKSRVLLSGHELADDSIVIPENVSVLNSLNDCILFLDALK